MKAILKYTTTENSKIRTISIEIINSSSALKLDEKLDAKLEKLEEGLDTLVIEYDNALFYTYEELEKYLQDLKNIENRYNLYEELKNCTDSDYRIELEEEIENTFTR